MSLKPEKIGPIPAQTVTVAQAAFPKSTVCMRIRDEIGPLFEDTAFAQLFSKRGQPALAPWRLALVTIFQFLENLSDRQAALMVRSRIDWKYALGLELTDCGFDFSVLSEFRDRLISGGVEQLLLNTLLTKLKALNLVRAGGRQRTDSTHVLAAVHEFNRLEFMAETLRQALNALAAAAPEWLGQQLGSTTLAVWQQRYGVRIEEYRLPQSPSARQEYASQVGQDGFYLLERIYQEGAAQKLGELEAVQILWQVWLHHYYREGERLEWRDSKQLAPTGTLITSPYDKEARYGTKRAKGWLGYKVHLTETCDEQAPRIITNVETTPGTVLDIQRLETIHQALAAKALAPKTHFVDAGYPDAASLVNSQERYQIELMGPVGRDVSWQQRSGQGYSLEQFEIEWSKEQVKCPEGKISQRWLLSEDGGGNEAIFVQFRREDCQNCEVRERCTKAKGQGRALTFRPQAQFEALQAARVRQESEEFKEAYRIRAGVEGSISQGVRSFGMRRSRYLGLAKTHLQEVVSAVALNLVRVLNWREGIPIARTRTSKFASLTLAS